MEMGYKAFPQSTFICVGGGTHTVELLVICGKMLDGGSDMVLLYAVDECGGSLSGKVRIFGVILEVAPA